MDLNTLRDRALKGEALSLEETRAVLQTIRRGYRAATEPKATRAPRQAGQKIAKTTGPTLTLGDIDKLF